MDICKAIEVNEFILEKATNKISERVEKGGWDNEEFEVMSKAIENLKELSKLGYKEKKEEYETAKTKMKRVNAYTEETEFETLIYKIAEVKNSHETMLAITTILAEHMEDIRVMQPRAYSVIMAKLKGLMM